MYSMLSLGTNYGNMVSLTCMLGCIATLVTVIPGGSCDEVALYNNLTQNYVRYVRPVKTHTDTINVSLAFELLKVLNVDEKTQVITVVGFFVAMWHDDYLQWNPSDWGGIELLVVPPNKIWIPDIGLENSAHKFYQTSFLTDFRCRIRYDGRVIWKFGGQIETICPLDMTYYPFDLQHCEMQIANWAYEGHEVDLHAAHDTVDLDAYEESGVWAMDHTNVTRKVHTYDVTGDIPFPEVSFHLYLRRKSLFYLLNLIIPCIFIITVALGVYWVPPDSGEKVSLGITVLLAFSVFLLVIAESTPETSDFSPILGKLVAVIMGLSTLSVLTSIVVLYVHHKHARHRAPAWLRIFAFRGVARTLCMCMSVPEVSNTPKKVMTFEGQASTHPHIPMKTVAMDTLMLGNCDGGAERDIRAILQHLTYLTDKYKQQAADEEVKDEWKALGKVIDRLMFWVSLLVIVIAVCIFTTQQDVKH